MIKTSELLEKRVARRFIDRFSFLFRGNLSSIGRNNRSAYTSISAIIINHFSNYSSENHPCKKTLQLSLEMLTASPAVILETGSSAWGANSSLLFDSYVNSFGGSFCSVDIRLQPLLKLTQLLSNNSRLHLNDSVRFLRQWSLTNTKVNLIYLDSYDVNWKDPIPSAIHCLNEYFAISDALGSGSLLLIDDTPASEIIMEKVQPNHLKKFITFKEKYGFYPGKGCLVKQHLESISKGKQVAHEYQLLWQF